MYGFLILNIEKVHTTVFESLNTNSNMGGSLCFSFLFFSSIYLDASEVDTDCQTPTLNITTQLLRECMGSFDGQTVTFCEDNSGL